MNKPPSTPLRPFQLPQDRLANIAPITPKRDANAPKIDEYDHLPGLPLQVSMREIDCYPTAFDTPKKCNLYEDCMQLVASCRVEELMQESDYRLHIMDKLRLSDSHAKGSCSSRQSVRSIEHLHDFNELGNARKHTIFKAIKTVRNQRLLNSSPNKRSLLVEANQNKPGNHVS